MSVATALTIHVSLVASGTVLCRLESKEYAMRQRSPCRGHSVSVSDEISIVSVLYCTGTAARGVGASPCWVSVPEDSPVWGSKHLVDLDGTLCRAGPTSVHIRLGHGIVPLL